MAIIVDSLANYSGGSYTEVVNADGTVTHCGYHGVTGPAGPTGPTAKPPVLAYGGVVRPSKHARGWQAKHPRNRKRR